MTSSPSAAALAAWSLAAVMTLGAAGAQATPVAIDVSGAQSVDLPGDAGNTVWFVDGARVTWREVFEDMPDRWDRDTRGHPPPRRRAGATVDVSGRPGYSIHPPGLSLLLAPLLVEVAAAVHR